LPWPALAVDAVLCGSVYSTADESFQSGVYQLPLSTGSDFKLVGSTGERKATGGGFFSDGIYYVGVLNNTYSYYGSLNFYPFNTETWEAALSYYMNVSPAQCGISSGYAVSPKDGTIYGCAPDVGREKYCLYTYTTNVDDGSMDKKEVAVMQKQLGALAVDANGVLYGIDNAGALYKISTTDGTLAEVGDTKITPLVDGEYVPFFHASSIINTANGTMYMAVQPAADKPYSLYSINTTTAKATKILDYAAGYVVAGLYMAEGAAEPGAPAAVTGLTASFTPGSLSGKVSFKAPGTTYSGDPLSGNLNFKVLANGSQVASGTVYSLSERAVDVTVPERGQYEIKVIVSNSVGDSPAAKIKLAIGYAAPASPVVTVTPYGSSAKIEWSPVSTTADGNPLSGEVSYKVVRYPDEKVIEENTNTTSCWDFSLGTELKAFRYHVMAICDGTPSEPGISPVVVAGSLETPFTEDFSNAEVMDLYSVIDANDDGCTWQYYSGEVRSQASDDLDGDDWLISPPISVSSGKYYVVSIDSRVYNPDLPGKFEIFAGDSPTVDAMTIPVIPATTITSEELTTIKGVFKVPNYSNKYLGIHSITEKGNWWLFATNLTVSEPYEGTVPSAPTEFTARSASDGSKVVTLTLKAPLTDLDGNTLSSIEKIEIKRGNDVIHTIPNPVPGTEYPYEDKDAPDGDNIYTATAINWSGTGVEAYAKGFAGINIPACVTDVSAYSTDVPGEVRLAWKPVSTFIDGSPMDASLVTYNVYTNVTGSDMKILANLTETEKQFQIVEPTEEQPQMFLQFGITSETAGGENLKGAFTDYVAVGEAYPLPYEESFPNLSMGYLAIQGGYDVYTYWDFASDNTFEEVQSQDNDNGMLAMFSQYKGSKAYFKTGLIDLGEAKNPMLTFYLYDLFTPEMANTNTIEIQVGEYNTFNTIKTVTIGDFGTEGWHRVEVPLTDYAGKTIQINLIGTANSFQHIHLDNLKVMDRADNDIAITDVRVPERVKAGNSVSLGVDIANVGLNDADAVTMELLRDGETIETYNVGKLSTDTRLTHNFEVKHSVATPEYVTYQVKLNYSADTNKDNNTASVEVITIYPNYPTITDLKATYADDTKKTVRLTWSQPELTGNFADDITEDFEGASPWTQKGLDDWTFIDSDGMHIYGFTFFNLPSYAPQPESLQSWFVFDGTYGPMVEHFSDPGYYAPHSGSKYIGSMAVTTGSPDYIQRRTDDWAISPELYGGVQTISFWAKSMLADALEEMEVLYSTTGKNIEDFELLKSEPKVPWTWTQYFVQLPEGAKYFAIRNHSRDAYVLMVDDVNFTPTSEGTVLEVSGYNVYRNGVQLNSEAVTEPHFDDELSGVTSPEYTVTALYKGRGESQFSNIASPDRSGLDTVSGADMRVIGKVGHISVIGAYDVEVGVYSIDGRLVNRLTRATGNDNIPVAAGTYIVKAGTTVAKVIVR